MIESQTITECELLRKLDLLLRTGCLLMESMADTARILRNMRRVQAYLGLPEENVHIFVNFNMLMVNLSDDKHSFSKFQRVDRHGVNLDAISCVSKLTWVAIKEDYSLDRYEEELEKIRRRPRNYSHWQVAVATGLACGGFCIQFGGDWTAFLYTAIAAMLAFRFRAWLNEKESNGYVNICLSAIVATILAWLMAQLSVTPAIASALPSLLVSQTPWHPLMACALFIVPGVPLINFVSDFLCGHLQVGLVRALNALIMLISMSFGIGIAIFFCGINNFVTDLSMTPHHTYFSYALAAAISAIGFSTIFNTPRRMLWVVALGGIIAICTRNFVNLGESSGNIGLDLGPHMGAFMGSAVVSIIAVKAIHWFHTPHQCIAIPSVIPMVPGVLMYRSLFAFIDMRGEVGEVTIAMYTAITAGLILLFISLGVAIPNVFVRRMTEPKKKRKLLDMIVERKTKRGEMVDLSEVRSE